VALYPIERCCLTTFPAIFGVGGGQHVTACVKKRSGGLP
jgi:hypothetical protein